MSSSGQFLPKNNSRFLEANEVADFVQRAFPDAEISWDKAEAHLQSRLEELVQIGAPDPIIEGHKNLFENVVFVRIPIQNEMRESISFFVFPDDAICWKSTKCYCERVQTVLVQIANCLDYRLTVP